MNRLLLDNISIEFEHISLFKNVFLQVEAEQSICISTGVLDGSTSLLKVIAGMLPVTAGKIYIDGQDIRLSSDRKRFFNVSLCFEHGGLVSTFTNYNNVAFPLIYHAAAKEREIYERIMYLAPQIGVEQLLYLEPHELNDVQTRLINLLRSLCVRPKLLLVDELQTGMSESMIERTLKVIQEQQREQGFALLMTTTAGDNTEFADIKLKIANNSLEPIV